MRKMTPHVWRAEKAQRQLDVLADTLKQLPANDERFDYLLMQYRKALEERHYASYEELVEVALNWHREKDER
jgi:hypothetical protein